MAGVQPGADLTRIVVGRRLQYAHAHYTSWTEGLSRVALGAIRTGTSNSLKMQDMVHFPTSRSVLQLSPIARMADVLVRQWRHALVRRGNSRIRTSEVRGVRALCLELHVARRSEMSESGRIRDIYAAFDHLFRALTLASSRDAMAVGASQPSGLTPCGTERMRSRLSMDVAEVRPPFPNLAEKEIYMALMGYALDKWEFSNGGKGIY